ncbi:unnamed protein product [Paramecium octaurelia]|uniref:Uncharacterized protein n=1 Tax=Paramecium octaurelia TaxID=43137 RepID=A0A8S1Y8M0_PAROT|nr:unnamed protein product [Paramecium octaurelia]
MSNYNAQYIAFIIIDQSKVYMELSSISFSHLPKYNKIPPIANDARKFMILMIINMIQPLLEQIELL